MGSLLEKLSDPMTLDCLFVCVLACARIAGNKQIEKITWKQAFPKRGRK